MDEGTIECVYGDTPSEFDSITPTNPGFLNGIPKRLVINGRPIALNNSSPYVKIIYKTIVFSFHTEWFRSLNKTSKLSDCSQLHTFLKWLNLAKITKINKYSLLKNYEEYRVNKINVKPQSTGLKVIIKFLNEGLSEDELGHDDFTYLDALLRSTTISANDEREPYSLTNYFANVLWLRGVMGDRDYLQLESPKRLMRSFSVTVASTLLIIIEAKKIAVSSLSDINGIGERGGLLKQKADQVNRWNREILSLIGKVPVRGEPFNLITELLLLDLVSENNLETLIRYMEDTNLTTDFPLSFSIKGSRIRPFREGAIFSRNRILSVSPLEEILFSWLCACQTVQPMDIRKLKKNDFVVSFNNNRRPIMVQCQYYKGRSGREQETQLLNANGTEGKAIIAFLDMFEFPGEHLFKTDITVKLHCTFRPHTPYASRIIRIWKSKEILKTINKDLKKNNATNLFIRAISMMAEHGGEGYDKWQHDRKTHEMDCSISTYRHKVKNPLPFNLFSLMAIKTTAVHSRTDRYRDGDFYNHNSHSSSTEKMHYLTDANKEWVNQNGRVTRMVLHDIENYVYKPNLNAVLERVHDMILRTKVIGITNSSLLNNQKVQINPLGIISNNNNISDEHLDIDEIIVLDTPETVVNMKHYIEQAIIKRDALINNALSFFERTVLPNVEWMSGVLQNQISPHILRNGIKDYEQIKSILPELFEAEMLGSIG